MRSPRFSLVTVFLVVQLSLTASFSHGDEVLRSRFEAAHQGFSIEFGETPLLMLEQLTGFYGARNFELIWVTRDGRVRPAAQTLLDAIEDAENHGLTPDDYHLTAIRKHLENLPENDADALVLRDLDMLLSDALLLLATHLQRGRTDPRVIDPQWNGTPLQPEWLLQSTAGLASPLTPESLSGFLADRLPRDTGYTRLQAARQKLVNLEQTGNWTTIENGPLLRPGGQDKRLPAVRQRLIQLGDLAENDDALAGDAYNPDVSAAVMAFQKRHGLAADGVIGPQTVTALNTSPEERIDRIDVNLERWRWLPRDLGQRYVMVNIAGFELRLVDQGQPALIKAVVVGRDYRRTPVFSDRIRYLVINPDWVVPPKLAVEDKLPEIRRDPNYLQRLGYRIYDGWGANRQVIDPASVDWQKVSPQNFPYRLVQEPGPLNALGQVKFMFPNQYNVYLHDTPSRDLFRQPERAFSSGCVRVQDPMELAALLLEQEGWTPQQLDDSLAAGGTRTVNLKQPVPVHIQYWTAWVDDNNLAQFRKDIYQRDEPIRRALRESQPL
ncbi:L,D-transpeptidase family protein [Marinobacter confluentis]|uniref:Peptidoglycan-binding protein n=1 Tax=Marinobacter confluentis TaxID=1697557 RepID=A0A4Z1C806_9GAMM|nr:L,D-transpeptidase family protein [Marinobacter confluentis]TGN39525.1 peptidoglycan-binding protein [Marinobacter confluentis]